LLYGPHRLLRSLKRDADGTLQPVPVEQAMDEIAARLGQIVDGHGPRSIAMYHGTQLQNMPAQSLMGSFMSAIGSPMTFSAFTVDKPGGPSRGICWGDGWLLTKGSTIRVSR